MERMKECGRSVHGVAIVMAVAERDRQAKPWPWLVREANTQNRHCTPKPTSSTGKWRFRGCTYSSTVLVGVSERVITLQLIIYSTFCGADVPKYNWPLTQGSLCIIVVLLLRLPFPPMQVLAQRALSILIQKGERMWSR